MDSPLRTFLILAAIVSFASFLFAGWLYSWVKSRHSSNKRIAQVGKLITAGANTFLKREYIMLSKFAGVAAALILVFLPRPIWLGEPLDNVMMALAYIAGAAFSAAAGT